ncbi:Uncharacterised protein [Mycobacteroides abscessus subsp. abscessus]|uniref:hypothetical protein n=1 Tax=Mycobacteroides abscessus TaxID=36809 RepID=UPI00092AB11D|nr:hypothetical protein [Mycobacteroides abscessus]SHP27725.1 Uncharacterised protein [Mycobacteroides abscessus subsp. abscessus]SHP67481.1 Uncharacterised protein [Mycobacteroides abscessus subsp. abscessus]SHY38777.1 Uncharacterised protein [Mycobacteroides abscessus subsp. abscessus]SKD94630.1 Uncharacterised protein [Mycobacteroides abscessus subsp. abscessus]
MSSPTTPSTAAKIRLVQDLALERGCGTAALALYVGLVEQASVWLDDADDISDNLRPLLRDSVAIAARAELPHRTVIEMGAWLVQAWDDICAAAAVLDALDEGLDDPFPATSPVAGAYRESAEELAQHTGYGAAACRYAGAQAEARWLRLYGGRTLDSLHELAVTDPVLQAARRELSAEEKQRVSEWVQDQWQLIDQLATEAAN